jgi:hypothetical protein
MFDLLPSMVSSFEFKEVGDITNVEYKGEFEIKTILKIADKKRKEQIVSIKMGVSQSSATPALKLYCEYLSELQVRVIKGPSWFKSNELDELIDENIIVALVEKIQEKEAEWIENIKKSQKENEENEEKKK